MKRCPQCWRKLPLSEFEPVRKRSGSTTRCAQCRARYDGWSVLPPGERARRARGGRHALDSEAPFRVSLVLKSGNRKLGKIPVSSSSSRTCPPSCSLLGAGCYAEQHWARRSWARVPAEGLEWGAFLRAVEALPPGQLWRHNEAGDLPGDGDALDAERLAELVAANRGRRGFTFTHKPLTPDAVRALRAANAGGFTVNVSADTLEQADRATGLGLPVAVVLPEDAPRRLRTPAGRMVIVCPAEEGKITCSRCALCSKSWRRVIVGFRAHGQSKKLVTIRLKEKSDGNPDGSLQRREAET